MNIIIHMHKQYGWGQNLAVCNCLKENAYTKLYGMDSAFNCKIKKGNKLTVGKGTCQREIRDLSYKYNDML